jgi:ABC-type ATPase with predicted acetyltransferase domain
MPCLDLVRSVSVVHSPRVMQMSGLFDVPPWEKSEQSWQVKFAFPEKWHVGLIVGPSGSGKTTLARALWGEKAKKSYIWDRDRSILDAFPACMSIKTITMLLSSVGFASPPLWVRPYHVLSTGEQFRVSMARLLAEEPALAIVDEFTSVVDRTVARIGSAAIAKTVREKNQQFVAVTCHYDVLEWLQPDWVYEPHTGTYTRREVWRHPAIPLTVRRVDRAAWRYFRDYHY